MERAFALSCGELRIPCKLTQPDSGEIRRVVLGVHGIGGSTGDAIQTGIAEEMEMFYSAVLRFDFPAHGESTCRELTLQGCEDSLLTAAGYLMEQYPQIGELCIFATGFGAYVTLICLDRLLKLTETIRLVVQTPSVRIHETLLRMLQVSAPTLKAMDRATLRAPKPFDITYSFYEELLANIALTAYPIPMLILQGEEDDFIRLSDIQQFRRINEGAKLVILPEISHRFEEEGAWDMVLDLTRDWFECEQVLVTDWE